jgi:hypothetical protein
MKPGTAKAKGRQTENIAVQWLRANGFPNAERRRLTGTNDQGDIGGIPNVCIEVKSAAVWAPLRWLRELAAETVNSGAQTGWVMARPKHAPNPDRWVIIMHPSTLTQLVNNHTNPDGWHTIIRSANRWDPTGWLTQLDEETPDDLNAGWVAAQPKQTTSRNQQVIIMRPATLKQLVNNQKDNRL